MDLRKYIGIPYKFNGRDFNGVDCFGLVKLFYENELNITLPDYPSELQVSNLQVVRNSDLFIVNIYKQFTKIDRKEVKYGDLILIKIFSSTPNHIGVAVNSSQFLNINEKQSSHLAKISKWDKFIVGVYRFVGGFDENNIN